MNLNWHDGRKKSRNIENDLNITLMDKCNSRVNFEAQQRNTATLHEQLTIVC